MIDINTLSEFLGWCTVINMGVLVFVTIFIIALKGFVVNIHSKLFAIDKAELPKLYFKYIANYKIGIILFNFVPYLVLMIMSSS